MYHDLKTACGQAGGAIWRDAAGLAVLVGAFVTLLHLPALI